MIIVTLPTKYAIELQLLGGVWILQTLPAIIIGLYTRWLHRWALVAGWAVGMARRHADGASRRTSPPTYPLELFGTTINAYTGVFALAANLVVTIALTLVLRRVGRRRDDGDETRARRTSTSSPRTPSIRSAASRRRSPSARLRSIGCASCCRCWSHSRCPRARRRR